MKRQGILLLSLLALGGCSLTAEPMQPFTQPQDLNDPDRDGVINARELCLETPSGAKVDNDGCSNQIEQKKRADLIVLFAHDKEEVMPEYLAHIEKMALFMREFKEVTLDIEGHTSTPGTEEYNQALSARRATEVKRILVEQFGVAPERLKIVPFGENELAIPETDKASEAANRRAVGSLMGASNEVLMKWNVYTPELKAKK